MKPAVKPIARLSALGDDFICPFPRQFFVYMGGSGGEIFMEHGRDRSLMEMKTEVSVIAWGFYVILSCPEYKTRILQVY